MQNNGYKSIVLEIIYDVFSVGSLKPKHELLLFQIVFSWALVVIWAGIKWNYSSLFKIIPNELVWSLQINVVVHSIGESFSCFAAKCNCLYHRWRIGSSKQKIWGKMRVRAATTAFYCNFSHFLSFVNSERADTIHMSLSVLNCACGLLMNVWETPNILKLVHNFETFIEKSKWNLV